MFNQRRFRGVINEDGYRYDVEVSAPHLHAAYDIVQRREGIKRSQLFMFRKYESPHLSSDKHTIARTIVSSVSIIHLCISST